MSQDVCVVVPTIREYECMREYVANAREHGFDTDRLFVVLVTEDFCDADAMRAMLDDLDVAGAVFDGSEREAWFADHGIEEYAHLVPAASHAQTSFGLLYLWANDFDYGVFIDDDTLPHDDVDFFGSHLANLHYEGEIEAVSSDESWVNVLYQSDTDLYPRGYPYEAMDEDVETDTTTIERGDVVASQGLWTNVPDLDAVRILMDGDLEGQAQTRTDASDFERDFVAAPGNYLTVCSMNLAFRREVVPAFYQFPMDDNEWNVGRFDDIWSGLVLKRAADVLGKHVYNGAPLCEHNKAPRSTFDDLQNEVAGLELNEHVWKEIDRAGPGGQDGRATTPSTGAVGGDAVGGDAVGGDAVGGDAVGGDAAVNDEIDDDADAYAAIAHDVGLTLATGDYDDYTNGAFLNHCGEYVLDWLDALDALSTLDTPAVPVPADD